MSALTFFCVPLSPWVSHDRGVTHVLTVDVHEGVTHLSNLTRVTPSAVHLPPPEFTLVQKHGMNTWISVRKGLMWERNLWYCICEEPVSVKVCPKKIMFVKKCAKNLSKCGLWFDRRINVVFVCSPLDPFSDVWQCYKLVRVKWVPPPASCSLVQWLMCIFDHVLTTDSCSLQDVQMAREDIGL